MPEERPHPGIPELDTERLRLVPIFRGETVQAINDPGGEFEHNGDIVSPRRGFGDID